MLNSSSARQSPNPTSPNKEALPGNDEIPVKLYEIASLLDAGIDKTTINTCLSLCDNGLSPQAIAKTIALLQDEATSHPSR
ncbi:uncharacterized protein V2V93DRAFT_382455 [Kockiozyma suomiensis]|uniref:uncharacterized protein n=1 Tax=Kockiozyma suomiensis TaxID=1337062 RepID=UPI0033433FC5